MSFDPNDTSLPGFAHRYITERRTPVQVIAPDEMGGERLREEVPGFAEAADKIQRFFETRLSTGRSDHMLGTCDGCETHSALFVLESKGTMDKPFLALCAGCSILFTTAFAWWNEGNCSHEGPCEEFDQGGDH